MEWMARYGHYFGSSGSGNCDELIPKDIHVNEEDDLYFSSLSFLIGIQMTVSKRQKCH